MAVAMDRQPSRRGNIRLLPSIVVFIVFNTLSIAVFMNKSDIYHDIADSAAYNAQFVEPTQITGKDPSSPSDQRNTSNEVEVTINDNIEEESSSAAVKNPGKTNVASFDAIAEDQQTVIKTQVSEEHEGEDMKLYILELPELTSDLTIVSNKTLERASAYYEKSLNEESAEIWLHRGMMRLPSRTLDPSKADVIAICAYLHLNANIHRKGMNDPAKYIQSMLLEIESVSDKVVLFTVPTWNPGVSRSIGIGSIMKMLETNNIRNIWSLGFERNEMWQKLPATKVIPVPYVLRPNQNETTTNRRSRINNFVFYAGDSRVNAVRWAGCNRTSLTVGLADAPNMDVRLVSKKSRISQSLYEQRMVESDYCLILCGDTPTSRSFASAIVSGCLPVRVGSRLRGLCEPPCHKGFGWTIAKESHLPFSEQIDWDEFPEVDEAAYIADSLGTLRRMFARYNATRKRYLQNIMQQTRTKWIYGWGDPVISEYFGDAVPAIWNEFVHTIRKDKHHPEGAGTGI